jgi:hypothetical protein
MNKLKYYFYKLMLMVTGDMEKWGMDYDFYIGEDIIENG